MISQPSLLSSSNTYLRNIVAHLEPTIIAPATDRRRGGLIINLSRHDLLIWFGKIAPADRLDWLVIPSMANCDIPFLFIGDIHGMWTLDDNKLAKIYEFYGD